MELDVQHFLRWYSNRRLRVAGVLPTAKTLRLKKVQLVRLVRLAESVTDQEACQGFAALAAVLSSRGTTVHLVDILSGEVGNSTVRGYLQCAQNFAEYAAAQRLMATGACTLQATDFPPSAPPPAIQVYSPVEMERFVSASEGKGLRWHLFMVFMVDHGRRVDEALRLEWERVRLNTDPPYVELPVTKNHEPQYVPLTKRFTALLTPECVSYLKSENDRRNGVRKYKRSPEEFLFPYTYEVARSRFASFCRDTGLPNRGFHNFRHTVITQRIAAGVPIQAVSSLAGHRNVQTTLNRYSHATALDYARFLDAGRNVEPNRPS